MTMLGLRVSLVLLSLCLSGSLAEVTCPNTPGEGIPGLDALMKTSTEGYVFHVDDLAPCECRYGYVASYISCMAVCGEDGTWKTHKEVFDPPTGPKEYSCVSIPCTGVPVDIILGSFERHDPLARSWGVGDKAVYSCEEGYMLAREGETAAECIPDGRGGGKWHYPNGEPSCIPLDHCLEPPEVEHATIVSHNGSERYGQAVYECPDEYRMMGDGVARCMRAWMYIKPLRKRQHAYLWVYIPQCQSFCSPPDSEKGDISESLLTIKKCVRSATNGGDTETCEQPVDYKVKKTDGVEPQFLPGVTLKFQGKELCVAMLTDQQKYQSVSGYRIYDVGSPRDDVCRSVCMDPCHGFERIYTEDTSQYLDDNRPFHQSQTIYKFKTHCYK